MRRPFIRSIGKKAFMQTWFDYVFAIAVGAVIMFLVSLAFFGSSEIIEDEITEKTHSIRGSMDAYTLLRTPVTLPSDFEGFGGARFGGAGAGRSPDGNDDNMPQGSSDRSVLYAPEEIPLAYLISRIVAEEDDDLKDDYKDLLEETAEEALDNAYGDDWELIIEDVGEYGEGVGGETYSSEAVIPTHNRKIIKVNLVTKKS